MSKKSFNKKGFSLIECSFLIVILGLISSGYFLSKTQTIEQNKTKITQEKIKVINEALKAHVLFYGKLPCPAPMVPASNSAKFGKEGKCDGTDSGVYWWDSRIGFPLCVGHVPIESLGLTPEYVFDGWGNFVIYKVINELTKETTFDNPVRNFFLEIINVINDGSMRVRLESLALNKAAYALISLGKDGKNYGAQQWPDNVHKINCMMKFSNFYMTINKLDPRKIYNCYDYHDAGFAEGNSENGHFTTWADVESLKKIKENWSLAANETIPQADFLVLEDGKFTTFDDGIYLVKKGTTYPTTNWGMTTDFSENYTLIELQNNGGSYTIKNIKDDFKEKDLILVQKHGYYMFKKDGSDLKLIFLGGLLNKNKDIFHSVDETMTDTFKTTNGLYLIENNPSTMKNYAALNTSCKNMNKEDLVKVIDKECFLVKNISEENSLIYVKQISETVSGTATTKKMIFKILKSDGAGGLKWENKYQVKDTGPASLTSTPTSP